MTIDECILDCIHYTQTELCKYEGINWSKSQIEQIAEWLEELRVYQQHEIIRTKGYNAGYNKAIDDLMKKVSECFISDADWNYLLQESKQLKEGANNGTDNQ